MGTLPPIPPRFFALRQDLGRRKSIRSPPHPGPKIGTRVASPQSSVFRFGIAQFIDTLGFSAVTMSTYRTRETSQVIENMERETGIEPATSSLGSRCSIENKE